MIKITQNGRPFDPKRFAEEIKTKAIEMGLDALKEKAMGAASSIIDPETDKYADVFVDRLPGNRVAIRTTGSPAYARLLEKRLGVEKGEVRLMNAEKDAAVPRVYLAHASEDKPVVRKIAEYLMAHGVDVWLDEWEIEPGDSLRQRMEEGLGTMTHFVVVLTPTSITKPWVAKEIDVGMVRQVGGESHFIPLLVDLPVEELSPFFQAMLFLKIDPTNEQELKGLVDRLYGVSRKPPLGSAPQYVQSVPSGLEGWSSAAVVIGQHFVNASQNAMPHDPIMSIEELVSETGLEPDDVKVAVLDLVEAGYLWQGQIPGHVAADCPLFVEFDEAYMPFSPEEDARTIANNLVTADDRSHNTSQLAEKLGWEPRRMNSAICYLLRAGVIDIRQALASAPWRAVQLIRTDRTLRFARNHA